MTLPERVQALVGELARVLEAGIPQDEGVLDYVRSTHGEGGAEAVREVLARRGDPDAATLAGLLLTAPHALRAALEDALERAACSPAEAAQLGQALEERVDTARVLLPGAAVIDIALEPGEVSTFVARLRSQDNPPAQLADLARERFGQDGGAALRAGLRQSRLEWSAQRTFFMAALLAGLDPGQPGAQDAVDWALTWLDSLPREAPAAGMLGAKHLELTARLRRSADFHAALAKSSFEVMMAQGARVSLPHPDAVKREIALFDAVCVAVTGRPGWTLAGLVETDLGCADDAESVINALGGL